MVYSKLISQALLRGGIPFFIMTGIAAGLKYGSHEVEQANGTFWAGLIMSAVSGASIVYKIDAWSLPKQSVVHFLIMLLTVYPCLLLSGWFPLDTVFDYIKVLGYFVATGVVMWVVFFFLFTRVIQ